MSKRSYPEPAPQRKSKCQTTEHRQESRCFHKTELRQKFLDMGYGEMFGEEHLPEVPCGFIYKQVTVAKVRATYFVKGFNIDKLGSSTNYSVAGFIRETLKSAQDTYPCPFSRPGTDLEEHACSQTVDMLDILGSIVFLRLSENSDTAASLLKLETRARDSATSIFPSNLQQSSMASKTSDEGSSRTSSSFCLWH